MARSVGTGRPVQLPQPRGFPGLPRVPELNVQEMELFSPAKGLDTTTRLSRLPKEYASLLKNYVLQRGRLEPRPPAVAFGGVASSPVMYAAEFITKAGTSIPFRLTTTGMDIYNSLDQVWQAVPGVTFTGGLFNFFSVTAFGSKLVISNGVDGLWEYDPQLGSMARITTSNKVPSAGHLTTFNGRVIATNVTDDTGPHPDRVRWSVKNNETLWDETDQINVGAGFQDLISSPDLNANVGRLVVPITETVALLIRSHSIDIMTATGFVDAPFQFNPLFPGIGTDSPYSFANIPGGGAMGFCRDNFYICTAQAPIPVGTQIIDDLLPRIKDPLNIQGGYDSIRQEYRAVIPETNLVWRYSFREKGWSNDAYPFTPRSISPVSFRRSSLTIDQLTGTVDSLVGTIDDLGLIDIVSGMYLTYGANVTREDPHLAADATGGSLGTDVQSGLLLPLGPLRKIEAIEMQLEYEASQSGTVTFSVSSDNGATWTTVGSFFMTPTNGPTIVSVRKNISAKQLIARINTATLAAPKIIALHVFVVPGGLIKP